MVSSGNWPHEWLYVGGTSGTHGDEHYGGDEDGDPTVKNDPDEGIVRLDYWLRGERKYLWPEVSNRIGALYKKRVISIKDAVDFLVNDQRVVPRDDVAREFKKHLDQD